MRTEKINAKTRRHANSPKIRFAPSGKTDCRTTLRSTHLCSQNSYRNCGSRMKTERLPPVYLPLILSNYSVALFISDERRNPLSTKTGTVLINQVNVLNRVALSQSQGKWSPFCSINCLQTFGIFPNALLTSVSVTRIAVLRSRKRHAACIARETRGWRGTQSSRPFRCKHTILN